MKIPNPHLYLKIKKLLGKKNKGVEIFRNFKVCLKSFRLRKF